MPSTTTNERELAASLDSFWEGAAPSHPQHEVFLSLLKRGRNFVCSADRTRMAPSRFVGYLGNTLARHAEPEGVDGGVTDTAITRILGNRVSDGVCEAAYGRICAYFDIVASQARRNYWVLSEAESAAQIEAAFRLAIRNALSVDPETRRSRLAQAPRKPEVRAATVVVFNRNADVVAEALLRSHGKCELCGEPAPFIRASDGTPYLEVQHRIRLADGGDDTVENAVAVCPNCHRRQHFG